MFAFITSILSSTFFGKLFKTAENMYQAKLTADTEAKSLAASLAVKNMEGEQEARLNAKEVRLATAGFWEMRLLTFVIAAPLAAHQFMVVFDTIDTGVKLDIPALPAPFDQYQGTILLSFFGLQVGNKLFDTLAYIFGMKRKS